MFKDDVLSERKDRERAQAQRDKLRRDLEILQSRNQSLQEQVGWCLLDLVLSFKLVFCVVLAKKLSDISCSENNSFCYFTVK